MFRRKLIIELEKWKTRPGRKPLIIRGARQVGKTTLVNQFSKSYEQYIYLNLENKEDKTVFENYTDIDTLLQTMFFIKDKKLAGKENTLIFIDEIQEVPKALNVLRYFYESYPMISVIAAGSMLESLFDKSVSFPVGRVEYKVLRPFSFTEYLDACGEIAAKEQLEVMPLNDFAHEKLLKLFHEYALIGGMPEVVSMYAEYRDLTLLSDIYESLIASYFEDVEKYASNDNQVLHLRHAIMSVFTNAGKRIKFEGFGNSSYKSRDMSEALRLIEKAFLIHLLYPVTNAELPIVLNNRKSPRLQVVDTGLLNYFAGLQKEVIGTRDLNKVYQGTIIEHLTGQELLALYHKPLSRLIFWTREKSTSMAEVDYLFPFRGMLIPVEVKAGKEGKLKSLHLFMDECNHYYALRFYAGKLTLNKSVSPKGKQFIILSLPYYAVSQIEKYIDWLIKKGEN